MTKPTEYSDRFNMAMKAAGKDAHAMAEALGVSYQAVMKVLAGTTKRLKSDNNSVAAKVIGVDPDWLATGEGEMIRRPPPQAAPSVSARALKVARLFDNLSLEDQRFIERFADAVTDPRGPEHARQETMPAHAPTAAPAQEQETPFLRALDAPSAARGR